MCTARATDAPAVPTTTRAARSRSSIGARSTVRHRYGTTTTPMQTPPHSATPGRPKNTRFASTLDATTQVSRVGGTASFAVLRGRRSSSHMRTIDASSQPRKFCSGMPGMPGRVQPSVGPGPVPLADHLRVQEQVPRRPAASRRSGRCPSGGGRQALGGEQARVRHHRPGQRDDDRDAAEGWAERRRSTRRSRTGTRWPGRVPRFPSRRPARSPRKPPAQAARGEEGVGGEARKNVTTVRMLRAVPAVVADEHPDDLAEDGRAGEGPWRGRRPIPTGRRPDRSAARCRP